MRSTRNNPEDHQNHPQNTKDQGERKEIVLVVLGMISELYERPAEAISSESEALLLRNRRRGRMRRRREEEKEEQEE